MAEGGYEDLELQERRKYGGEYDNLDRETLDTMYDELNDKLDLMRPTDTSRDEFIDRMKYINIRREYLDSARGEESDTPFTTDEVPNRLVDTKKRLVNQR